MTSSIGGLFGWFLQLVTAYTVIDIEGVLTSDLGQPFAAYLLQVLPRNLALAVLTLTIICAFSMGQGCMVAASRVTYAYARDDVFPLSRIWKRVNKTTQTPVNAVWFNTVIGICLTLLIFAGPIAIGAVFSIAAIAAFVAFTIPIAIRTFFVGNRFRRGPWHLGRASPVIGTLATAFTALMIPILCLPSTTGKNLGPSVMNWTCLVWGGPMLAVMVWWVLGAHRWFKGPKVNVKHAMLGREGNLIVGKPEDGSESASGAASLDGKAGATHLGGDERIV
jgi:amino acid transporter